MSNFIALTRHPVTNQLHRAWWMDNYFGPREYGILFDEEEKVWRESQIQPSTYFVFGSNLAGRHGKGAALAAKQLHGAKQGHGIGPMGWSYAIPTKDAQLRTLRLETIAYYVAQFLEYAKANPDKTFRLTPIGCGLAGYKPFQIAPMFANAPSNVNMPDEFNQVLEGKNHE